MYDYTLSFRFNSSDEDRYNQVYVDFTTHFEKIGGKKDATTSNFVFHTVTSPAQLRNAIKNYYNKHKDLINTEDNISIYSVEQNLAGAFIQLVSELKFRRNTITGKIEAYWEKSNYAGA